MAGPLVSILVPCYNAERYVAEAIRSALAQSYEPVEVIVLDDGSTDDSLDVIKQFDEHEAFRWESWPNRGGNAARNRLLEMAQGEYVQFLDADDLLSPHKVRQQVGAFETDVDAVFCDLIAFRDGELNEERAVCYPDVDGDLLLYFITHSVITMLPIHRRSVLLEAGGFDESLPCCQEYELHARLAATRWRRVVHLTEPLCRYRRLSTAVSANEARVFTVKAKLLTRWYEELSAENHLTHARVDAIAEALYACGRHLARHGLEVEAAEAFRYARRIAPKATRPARLPLRILTRLFGPVHAERLRSLLRRGWSG